MVLVGNITVGGTGKTPAVAALVAGLKVRGLRCGVVCRGYGGTATAPELVYGDSDPARCGDEAVLLARLTEVPVAIGSARPAAVRKLLETHGLDIIIGDDGLQHYALARDFEVAVHDSRLRFGNGHLLPVGPLREPPRRLATVDWVLERGGVDPFSAYHYRPVALENLLSGERRDLGGHRLPASVHALAGIGAPEKFFTTLRELGFEPEEHPFPDHHRFASAELAAMDDKPLLMTEKDAVKIQPFAQSHHWFLRIEAELPNGLLDAVAALVEKGTAE